MQQALEAIPNSLLLNFFIAEVHESRTQLDAAKERYEHLLTTIQAELDEVKPKLDVVEAKAAAIEAAEQSTKKKKPIVSASKDADDAGNSSGGEEEGDDHRLDDGDQLLLSLVADESGVGSGHVSLKHELLQTQYKTLVDKLNSVWIQYMRFSRRSEVACGVLVCVGFYSSLSGHRSVALSFVCSSVRSFRSFRSFFRS